MLDIDQIYNIDCVEGMNLLPDRSIDLMITSPPYYNARDYSQWGNVEAYIDDMERAFTAVYRVLKNHRYAVVNVGDITCKTGASKWAVRKLPLGAYFVNMLERIGFQYIDDFIWDKGEPQTKRHLGNPPFPFYQYPVNCYEHILIFAKHELDKNKIPCPDCGETITQSNSCTAIGVQSWECKNPNCPTKSAHGRGKRFSARSVMMTDYQKPENQIPKELSQAWRRDIVKISPVIKTNCKGKNTLGHTAPFPAEIPEMAIKYYSGVGDVILDPFMGSGTVGEAAITNDRHYIGFDIVKEYCDIAEQRISRRKL